jgi:hypothetical protein
LLANTDLLKKEAEESAKVLTERQRRPRIMRLQIPDHLADGGTMGNVVNKVSILLKKQDSNLNGMGRGASEYLLN